MRIVFILLIPHQQNEPKHFPDDIKVKKSKTTKKNKKQVQKMRRYVVEHIQNLNQIFANKKRDQVIIPRVRSPFCRVSIKTVEDICNADGCSLDIFKVFKIFD